MLSFLRHCPHSPTARRVDERRCYTGRAAIDRILLPAGPTAANLLQWVCCCGPILGQTTVAVVRWGRAEHKPLQIVARPPEI